jgi:hypothetical protein
LDWLGKGIEFGAGDVDGLEVFVFEQVEETATVEDAEVADGDALQRRVRSASSRPDMNSTVSSRTVSRAVYATLVVTQNPL